jgi:sialidase-1
MNNRLFLAVSSASLCTLALTLQAADPPTFEAALDHFLGQPQLETTPIFQGGRFPNVVVATDGTVLATWGVKQIRVRRSEDGGETWGDEINLDAPENAIHGGGVTVDETTGDIFLFVEAGHPPAPITVFRSQDHGLTWQVEQDVSIGADENNAAPSMHMNEAGISLRHGDHAGRLIRPSRSYAGGNDRKFWPGHYTNAIYSDDHGKTWKPSSPFPIMGTGEAALVELADGTIYYNSRRHHSTDGLTPRMRYSAYSDDGGHSWRDVAVSELLPDGNQDTDYGLMGGLVRLPVEGRDILIFSNVESEAGRRNGTLWASFDGGKTWPVKRLVTDGNFAYSSLNAGRPDTASEGWIYLLYEARGGTLARLNLSWLLAGEPTGDGSLPDWLPSAP